MHIPIRAVSWIPWSWFRHLAQVFAVGLSPASQILLASLHSLFVCNFFYQCEKEVFFRHGAFDDAPLSFAAAGVGLAFQHVFWYLCKRWSTLMNAIDLYTVMFPFYLDSQPCVFIRWKWLFFISKPIGCGKTQHVEIRSESLSRYWLMEAGRQTLL